jgi:hypothetical protein
LLAAITHAVTEDELISRNVVALVRLPSGRSRKVRAWSVTEACQFLESARTGQDPLYVAYVLMLVLGLRRGEVLGLPWLNVHLDVNELDVSWHSSEPTASSTTARPRRQVPTPRYRYRESA